MKKLVVTKDNARALALVFENISANQRDLAAVAKQCPVEYDAGIYRRVWTSAAQVENALIELGSALADFHHPPEVKNRLYLV